MINGYAGCMQGNMLDTTCSTVLNAVTLDCGNKGIYDLTGIQYFRKLRTFKCNGNDLSWIPPLTDSLWVYYCGGNQLSSIAIPPSLHVLRCESNQINVLPALPSTLTELKCENNSFSTLPPLPAGLTLLHCGGPSFSLIPSLPPALTELFCQNSTVNSLPALPSGLEILELTSNTQLTNLPFLPSSLEYLGCGICQLTVLPTLPNGLRWLYCFANQISILPSLPDSLLELRCNVNQVISLPQLPSKLRYLDCEYNNIDSLPVLPSSLTDLICNGNLLTQLPALPSGMIRLYCEENQLTSLPALPDSLNRLDCSHNLLTSIPPLPAAVSDINMFYCNNNFLTALPDLPPTITYLDISDNPILCLPQIGSIDYFYWSNTGIVCLPNIGNIGYSSPLLNGVPLCDYFNSCMSSWNISGHIYFDVDSSCTFDSLEVGLTGIPVVLDSGGMQLQIMYTRQEGRYSFQTGFGNYTIRVDTLNAPFKVVCPLTFSANSILTAIDSMDTDINFGLLCDDGFDLEAKSIAPWNHFRPGNQVVLSVHAGDGMRFSGIGCANGIGGSVQLIMSGLLTYVSPKQGALTPSSISGDTVVWLVNDLSQVDPALAFNFIGEVSTTATINDSICFQLSIFPGADNIPSNNSYTACYPVLAAFDPNEKYMSPSGIVDTSQQWFEFTIFFQNVGTAPAEDIYILDTLDQNLDATTFTYLSSSHDVITQLLPGNILRFNYPDINLADSTTDEPASHGYVKFKVKRNENLPLNTTIENTAHIFFDFNAAVVTNTTQATLTTSVGMIENVSDEIILYPNPAQSQLTVDSKQYAMCSIEIRDLLGQEMYFLKTDGRKKVVINLSELPDGIYILIVNSENTQSTKKILKQ